MAQQQLGNSLIYVRDTDPLARGRSAAAGYEGMYLRMQVELVSKGLHHSDHSRAKTLLLADSLRHQVADGLPRRRAGRAQTAALAGEGEQELLLALRATDAGQAVVENAAVEVAGHHAVDQTAPEAVTVLEALLPAFLEALVEGLRAACRAASRRARRRR